MKSIEVNRLVFYFKIGIQLAVLVYLMVGTGITALLPWMGGVAVLVVISNCAQMKLEEEAVWPRVVWLLLEWLFFLTLFPFVAPSPYYILMIVLLASAVIAIEPLIIRLVLVFLFAITPILHHSYKVAFDWKQVVDFSLLVLFFVVFSYFFRRYEEQHFQLEKLNESLRGYVEKEKEWALEQERNRIARNLHDTVAHQSTGLIIQLQKLRKAYELGRDPDVRASINESEQVARSMLNDMRQSVRMISPVETTDSPFEQMFSDYAQLTEMKIRHQGIDEFYALSLSHQADLYAICQEALTNAKRHGRATAVDIFVRKEETHLVLTIQDNGIGVGEACIKGFGLTKMAERVKEARGECELLTGHGMKIAVKWPLLKGDAYDSRGGR